METEKENKLSFLEIEIIREQGKFTTTVYRNYTRTRQIYNHSLSKLYASKANLQPQFIEIIREQGKFTTTVYRNYTRARQIYNHSLSKLYANKANLQPQFIEIIREQGKFTTAVYRNYTRTRQIYNRSLSKLYANKFTTTVYRKSTLLVAYIVTLKVFYLWFINLVWYIL